jgi:hypothetical protein
MAIKIWNSATNVAEDALELPQGRIAADVGFWVEQDVNPDDVLEAAQAVIDAKVEVKVASQAKLLVVAQEKGLALQTWGEIRAI